MPLHYQNPVIHADYADPDVIRVENDFWMVSSSFNQLPALPILHSRDLIHWRIVNHAVKRLPSPEYDAVQHGRGSGHRQFAITMGSSGFSTACRMTVFLLPIPVTRLANGARRAA